MNLQILLKDCYKLYEFANLTLSFKIYGLQIRRINVRKPFFVFCDCTGMFSSTFIYFCLIFDISICGLFSLQTVTQLYRKMKKYRRFQWYNCYTSKEYLFIWNLSSSGCGDAFVLVKRPRDSCLEILRQKVKSNGNGLKRNCWLFGMKTPVVKKS